MDIDIVTNIRVVYAMRNSMLGNQRSKFGDHPPEHPTLQIAHPRVSRPNHEIWENPKSALT